LGSDTFSPADNPSQTSTASALILLNGDTGQIFGADTTLGKNIRTDQRTLTSQTVTDVFVYDTAKDSDGGIWRNDERAKASSWYNETIDHTAATCVFGTDDRCGTREFPAKAIIIATTTNLFVYDAYDNTLWMAFNKGSGATENMIGPTTNSTGSSVWALNGKMYYGNNGSVGGLYAVDFVNDRSYKYDATNDYVGDKTVGNRNSTVTWTAGPSSPIVNATINDVFVRVINGKTYVTVGTDAGISVINETDRTVFDYDDEVGAADNDYNSVWLDRDGNLWDLNETAQQLDKWANVIADTADEDPGNPDSVWDETSTPALFESAQTIGVAPGALFVTDGTSTVDGKSPTAFVGHNGGLTVLSTKAGDETNGSVKYYADTYISEEMVGDVRAMWPLNPNSTATDLEDLSVKTNDLTAANIDSSDAASGVRREATDFDGSTENLSIPNASDADLDFNGTEAFTISAWVYPTTMAGSGEQDGIITKWDETSTLRGYRLVVTNDDADTTGNFKAEIYDESADQTITASSPNDSVQQNTWYHVVMTFNGGVAGAAGDLKLYIDGVLSAQNTLNASFLGLEDVANDFVIADYDATDVVATNTGFAGRIDEVAVTAETLTAGQILHTYEVGRRALQNHTASRITGVTGADNYQRLLGNASGGVSSTARVFAVAVDDGNQFLYAGLNSSGDNTGGVTVLGIDSDSAVDLYDATANTAQDDDIGTQFNASDILAISVAGSPCPDYNSGTTACNNSATLAIAGTDDTNYRVWMESSEISLYSALSLIGSSTLTKNDVIVNNMLTVYSTYNNLAQSSTGERIDTPALSVNSSGNFVYNYLGTSTSATAMDFNDATLTTGVFADFSSSSLTTGDLMRLTVSNAAHTGAALQIVYGGADAGFALRVNDDGTTTDSTPFVILGNGNVGIGVPNPSTKLQIGGSSSTISNTTGDIIINSASDFIDFSGDTLMNIGGIGINDTSPDYELEISSAASSDPSFALSDGDITHGLTTLAQTDVILHVAPLSSTAGGAQITALTESDAQALSIRGVIGSTAPTDTTPAIKFVGAKSNGTTGIADLDVTSAITSTTAETVFQIANNDDTAGLTMLGNGNIAIGNNTAPLGKVVITSNPLGPAYSTGHAALIVDQFESQDIITASASGTTKFRVKNDADVVGERFVDLGSATTYYLDPANGTTSLFVDGNIISNGAFSITSNGTNGNITVDAGTGVINLGGGSGSKQVCVSTNGGSTCTGKIDALNFDPPYTINGKNYRTFAPSMSGVKEETVGTITTQEYVPGVGYRAQIDFTSVPDGSDLWVFSRTTDIRDNADKLVVLLSPSSSTKTWYTYDPSTLLLSIFTSRPTTVSYRLTAPRYDWRDYGNTRPDDDNPGLAINYASDWWTAQGDGAAPVDPLANLVIEPLDPTQTSYRIRDTTSDAIIEEASALSRALIANIQTGIITGVNGVFGRVVLTESIVSPVAEIHSLRTNVISPIATEFGTVSVNLGPAQTLSIKNTQTEEVVTSFDSLGNATVSGDLHVGNLGDLGTLQVRENASISGELYADRIVSNFGDLSDRFRSIETTLGAISSQSASPTPASQPTPTSSPSASPSTIYADAISVSDGNVTVNTSLFVLGDTLLSSTSITGSLLVDGIIRFAENVIETIGETLYIQKNKLGNVDILDGTIIADIWNRVFVQGFLAISGNTTVGGVLGTATLSPLEGGNLTINLGQALPDPFHAPPATPSAGFADLVITGRDDQTVAVIDASGSATFAGHVTARALNVVDNIHASGSATINKLNISLTETMAATDSAIPTNSVGTGLLPAHFSEVTILTNQVAEDSLVYLTPLSTTGNQVLYVKEKLPGVGFMVAIDTTLTTAINFNWWVIN
jgi:hypothetical protein